MKFLLTGFVVLFLITLTPLAQAETKVCFSPNGNCQQDVILEITKARKSIDIAMYSFSSKAIAQALIEAQKRQVKVKVSLDIFQIKDPYSKSRYLIKKGVNVRFHMGPGIMHDMFAVIDDRVVLTGSYDWTVTADKKNAENLVTITDGDLAKMYNKQFKLLWSQSGEGSFKETETAE